MKSFKVRALKVSQPIGDYFVAVFPSKQISDITYVDIRTLVDERLDKFMGTQRGFSKSRVKEIQHYISTNDATFPTSIVISVPECCAIWHEDEKELELREYIDEENPENSIHIEAIAKIIDGQHRVRGLEECEIPGFEVHCAVFVGADEETEATIFATVNLSQTKVNKSLVYDLFSFSKSRSPQKTCHDVAVTLNAQPESPLFHMIKRLGTATPGRDEKIAQATFVDSLLPFITKDPFGERDQLRRGKNLSFHKEQLQANPFRDLFVSEDDVSIAKNIWSFFSAVSQRWEPAWISPKSMLSRTNGFRGLMRYFHDIAHELRAEGNLEVIPKTQISKRLDSIKLESESFTTDNFKPGSSGSSRLYRSLKLGTLVD